MRRLAPAIGLFFLAPLVAEFLLGDFPITYLFALFLLAPMYGTGAILIREVVRRAGRGWPSMILLALAYGVFEEGITTQSLFDPNYADAHLLKHGFVPALGIAIPWTIYVLSLHAIWSISTPIAVVEAMSTRGTTPWLNRRGMIIMSIVFVIGSGATLAASYSSDHYIASPTQLTVVVLVVAALILTALRLPLAKTDPVTSTLVTSTATAPNAWLVLVAALIAGAVLQIGSDVLPTWLAVVAVLAAELAIVVAVRAWSARSGWGANHRLALAAGALLTYAWHAFGQSPVVAASGTMSVISHIVFAIAALVLLAIATRRVRRPVTAEVTEPEPSLV
jgi:hypothetical protein